MSIFERTDRLIGLENREKLNRAHVAVFGLGGVGSYVCEALTRAGIGHLTLIDGDCVAKSNINRQLYALNSTVGLYKADVAKARIADINPDCLVDAHNIFYCGENADIFDFSTFDYVVDAIDTVTSKLLIIEKATACNTKIISSMGTGNKLDASAFKITDRKKPSVCPLARVMRKELKDRGIEKLTVLYSEEKPINPTGERTPASVSFVPSVAGILIAGEVIKELIR